jgi:hypothetical protein
MTLRQSNNPPNRKAQTRPEQRQEHAHNSFDIKGIVRKEFVLVEQHSIPYAALTFNGDCVKMCKGSQDLWRKKELAVASRKLTN